MLRDLSGNYEWIGPLSNVNQPSMAPVTGISVLSGSPASAIHRRMNSTTVLEMSSEPIQTATFTPHHHHPPNQFISRRGLNLLRQTNPSSHNNSSSNLLQLSQDSPSTSKLPTLPSDQQSAQKPFTLPNSSTTHCDQDLPLYPNNNSSSSTSTSLTVPESSTSATWSPVPLTAAPEALFNASDYLYDARNDQNISCYPPPPQLNENAPPISANLSRPLSHLLELQQFEFPSSTHIIVSNSPPGSSDGELKSLNRLPHGCPSLLTTGPEAFNPNINNETLPTPLTTPTKLSLSTCQMVRLNRDSNNFQFPAVSESRSTVSGLISANGLSTEDSDDCHEKLTTSKPVNRPSGPYHSIRKSEILSVFPQSYHPMDPIASPLSQHASFLSNLDSSNSASLTCGIPRVTTMESSLSQAQGVSIAGTLLDASIEDTGISPETVQAYISNQDPVTHKWTCLYPNCGKIFGRRENIRAHIQTHLGDRQYRCNICHKSFVRQHDLKRHMKIHSGEKPYKCACNQGFARQDALTRHRQRGMCEGAFPDAVRRPTRRGRPRKLRQSMDERRLRSFMTHSIELRSEPIWQPGKLHDNSNSMKQCCSTGFSVPVSEDLEAPTSSSPRVGILNPVEVLPAVKEEIISFNSTNKVRTDESTCQVDQPCVNEGIYDDCLTAILKGVPGTTTSTTIPATTTIATTKSESPFSTSQSIISSCTQANRPVTPIRESANNSPVHRSGTPVNVPSSPPQVLQMFTDKYATTNLTGDPALQQKRGIDASIMAESLTDLTSATSTTPTDSQVECILTDKHGDKGLDDVTNRTPVYNMDDGPIDNMSINYSAKLTSADRTPVQSLQTTAVMATTIAGTANDNPDPTSNCTRLFCSLEPIEMFPNHIAGTTATGGATFTMEKDLNALDMSSWYAMSSDELNFSTFRPTWDW